MADPYSTGDVGTFVGTVGNSQVDPLTWYGLKWGPDGAGTPAHLTYSFPTYNAAWLSNYYGQEPFQTFQPFTAAQQTAAKKALLLWSEVANITFEQVAETSTSVGEIRFANSGAVTNSEFVAWAYGPYEQPGEAWPENGDVWFDKKYPGNLKLNPGQEGFSTMLHEIGHALGLDHPFLDSDPSNPDPNEPVLFSSLDTDQYTVMSYTAELSTQAYASTPQMLDILAIQYMYGANMTTRAGDTVYKFPTTEVNKTIWDAGGIDTLDFSNQGGAPVQGTLEGGTFFRFGGRPASGTSSILGIAYTVTIENVIGSNRGNTIDGNNSDNRMIGGNGVDRFIGWGGDDHLEGKGGNDDLRGGLGNNWIDGGAGHDYLGAGTGNNTLIGGAGNDTLESDPGDDWLDGGLGNDTMRAGAGNDTYVVNALGDIIDEGFYNDSGDVVRSSIAVNLTTLGGGKIEHAVLLGAAGLSAIGNGANNALTGNNGANKLDGGAGADTLIGGKGGDTYTVDDAGDVIIEDIAGTAGGIDTVKSSIDYSLALLGNVEKLTLIAGFGDLEGTGNGLNNTLTGNEGANTLNGAAGKDAMIGGAGDDHYFVDNLYDVVTETILNTKGGGIDTVESSVTYSLAARANVDHLILTGGNAINGTGNGLNNEVTGNDAANKLDGGAGNDVLVAGDGNDTLLGGLGNDLLDGGDGADRMTGGAGNDIFDFNLLSELGDVDVITDFKKGFDLLDISNLLDDALYAGSDIFADGVITFTYVTTTTNIWFDADGTAGGGAALSLASLLNVNLASTDSASFIV